MRHAASLVVLVFLSTLCASLSEDAVLVKDDAVRREEVSLQVLEPGVELLRQSCTWGATRRFAIAKNLPVNAAFEVRVSYLSTTPAVFAFDLLDDAGEDVSDQLKHIVHKRLHQKQSGHESESESEEKTELRLRRRQLNTERFRIITDVNGCVVRESSPDGVARKPILAISVIPEGVLAFGAQQEEHLVFNIVMDRLYIMNSVPEKALSMIIWGVVCVTFALACLAPFVHRLLTTHQYQIDTSMAPSVNNEARKR
mmetsp:Transcript_10286/g.20191  ORF Transcript_10286/g.20191 Transcript_10286/m.20191 type:complete len:255 (+) Transcript_10286:84-848(+)